MLGQVIHLLNHFLVLPGLELILVNPYPKMPTLVPEILNGCEILFSQRLLPQKHLLALGTSNTGIFVSPPSLFWDFLGL